MHVASRSIYAPRQGFVLGVVLVVMLTILLFPSVSRAADVQYYYGGSNPGAVRTHATYQWRTYHYAGTGSCCPQLEIAYIRSDGSWHNIKYSIGTYVSDTVSSTQAVKDACLVTAASTTGAYPLDCWTRY